jgi:hypothetical protein
VSTSLQLAPLFLTLASFWGLCVFGLWRSRSVAFQLILAVLAGCFTYFIVATAISLASPSSLASSMYFRAFGLAPYLGHMFDPDYTGKEGLVFRMPWVGIWVDHLVTIGFWSLLFATLYFYPLRRWRRTI